MMSLEFSENDLSELLEYVSGKGKFWFLGNGISTYPNGNRNSKKLFMACLELEKRGKIYRHVDEKNHVLFKACE